MKIRLKGVKNVRDFSEYGHGDFIRSAHLHKLTAADGEKLRDGHHLRTIIDLRTSQEVSEKPDAEIPGVAYVHIPIFEGAVPGVSHEEATDKLTGSIPDMPTLYRMLVTEEEHVGQFTKVMEIVNDPHREGAILWHCTEGKDRCGIVSALFLLSRGVERGEVLKDYMKTNRTNYAKAWAYYALVLLSKRGRDFAGKVRDAFLAKREYLEPIMDILTELSGRTAQ